MSKITKTDSKFLTEVIEAADLYRPTPDQRLIKAEFQVALANGPSPEKVTAAFAVQITNRGVIERWWPVPGFREWFLDASSFENRAEAYANNALEIANEIACTAMKDGDRMSAVKFLVEVAGKIKKHQTEEKFLDESIQKAGLNELNKMIEKALGESNDKK